ncbi:hypothetical protein DS891_07115 [Pseudoalteromonas sp. JC28]|uniref:hypothetical protein n=1 Tax=Pseudoalteromonas sp. JC28 TaxID=2267617 RepID=UPI001572CF94|nr:hypothetical protein [Pseudoalteromonas sp. JC28]NSY33368.1 hypothetical protein [Pseudoalteromonas sp. JC28]
MENKIIAECQEILSERSYLKPAEFMKADRELTRLRKVASKAAKNSKTAKALQDQIEILAKIVHPHFYKNAL